MSEYVKIHLGPGKQIITLMRLKTLESFLPPEDFMRVHRSYIVNLRRITTIERNRIVFYGNVFLPVSEQYKSDFKRFIDDRFL
jgi:DNA-binding LytR/AlgR family response regulator